MPTPEEIAEAIAEGALSGVKRSKSATSEIEYFSPKDRQVIDLASSNTVGALPLFGMRRVQQVPPGAG